MRNAEEFSGRRSGLRRTLPAYRGPGPSAAAWPAAGRIRYAHGGGLPRVDPFRTGDGGARRGEPGLPLPRRRTDPLGRRPRRVQMPNLREAWWP
jgi:hypothetical protein